MMRKALNPTWPNMLIPSFTQLRRLLLSPQNSRHAVGMLRFTGGDDSIPTGEHGGHSPDDRSPQVALIKTAGMTRLFPTARWSMSNAKAREPVAWVARFPAVRRYLMR